MKQTSKQADRRGKVVRRDRKRSRKWENRAKMAKGGDQ